MERLTSLGQAPPPPALPCTAGARGIAGGLQGTRPHLCAAQRLPCWQEPAPWVGRVITLQKTPQWKLHE